MNIILIICSVYAALYGRVIALRIRSLCTYMWDDSGAVPYSGKLSDVAFVIGCIFYAAALGVVASEVLQFIWSFY